MSKPVLLFPGQGSQAVGMGADIVAQSKTAAAIFEQADEILGFSLSSLCFQGPESDLNDTLNAQPALLTTSVALLSAIEFEIGHKLEANAAAGHSMGEYSALVAAGSLDFPDALKLVRERGRLMKLADERATGGMAAVIALDTESIKQICVDASEQTGSFVHIANDNCPGQVVISGDETALVAATAGAKTAGARKVVRLPITIAAHSPLMAVVEPEFALAVEQTDIKAPRYPVIANITAEPVMTSLEIKNELVGQLQSSVQWTRSMQYLIAEGNDLFIEIGPGGVLASFMKRIDRRFRRSPSIAEWADVESIAAKLA